MVSIGQRWRQFREAAGLSVIDAARLADVHRNTIYDLEKEAEGVTLRMMRRVAPIYGITLADIFEDDSKRSERVPAEFRPLLEPLRPLDQQQREAIIRNVASNLMMMSMVYGSAGEFVPMRMAAPGPSEAAPKGEAAAVDDLLMLGNQKVTQPSARGESAPSKVEHHSRRSSKP